jgi:uncharacterized protein with gpF-like domain
MFDGAKNRVKTIARTEINSAANGGKFIGFKDAGVEKHEWLNSFDSDVREAHSNNVGVGGEVVELGESFSNGLVHPGDPGGDPGEVINCRCTTIAVKE